MIFHSSVELSLWMDDRQATNFQVLLTYTFPGRGGAVRVAQSLGTFALAAASSSNAEEKGDRRRGRERGVRCLLALSFDR